MAPDTALNQPPSVVALYGVGHLARAGKQQIAETMCLRGKSFIRAAILLRRQNNNSEHDDYVALHLLCQGTEVLLKGLLLLKDYDGNVTRLRRLGHNLCNAATRVLAAYGLKPLRADLASELDHLSNLYANHLLRYASGYDIFVDPRTIPRERVLRRLYAAVRLTARELRKRNSTAVPATKP
jgi:hypothetical protein